VKYPILPRTLSRLAFALALLAIPGVYGCFDPFHPLIGSDTGVSEPPPVPDSPQNALRLLEWSYNHKAIDEYRELFTADYRFAFAALDTNGNAYRGDTWTRDDELESTRKLFEGGDATQPAASIITLVLDRNFRVQNDTRPGKYDPDRRKTITTQVNLTIQTVDGTATNVNGKATFFLVRGDSADIPEDLGLAPDPNRWYIERWEDQTFAPTIAQAMVAAGLPPPGMTRADLGRPAAAPTVSNPRSVTWGAIKRWYRQDSPF